MSAFGRVAGVSRAAATPRVAACPHFPAPAAGFAPFAYRVAAATSRAARMSYAAAA